MSECIDSAFTAEDIEKAKSLVGRILTCLRHSEGSLCMDGLEFVLENGSFFLSADIEPINFYGSEEEAVRFHISDESPFEDGAQLVEDSIGQKITGVSIVNDTLTACKKDGTVVWVHTVTTALVITLEDGCQIAAERFDHFLEAVDIYKGNNVVERLSGPDYLLDDGPKGFKNTVERKVENFV